MHLSTFIWLLVRNSVKKSVVNVERFLFLFTRHIFLVAVKVLVMALFGENRGFNQPLSTRSRTRSLPKWMFVSGGPKMGVWWWYQQPCLWKHHYLHVTPQSLPIVRRLSPPPSSPHLQCWSLAHVLAVYHSRRRETHRAVMDGPGAKTAPIAYQLPISTHLAGCQCAPRPIQVNEIRCKCRYNGAFCRVQITQCQLGCPPVGSVSRWMRERVWEVCVGLLMCVCVDVGPCACHEAIRWFPRLIRPVEAQLLACLSVRLLIADHTSYVTSPWILQVDLSLTRSAAAAAGQYNLGGETGPHTGTRTSTITHSHTHRWGDSDGWHYRSCVAPNGLLKWLIKGKQLLRKGRQMELHLPLKLALELQCKIQRGSDLALGHYCYWN